MSKRTASPTPSSIEEAELCAHILQRIGESGQPPEFGIRRINVGTDGYLDVLERFYFQQHLRRGASFKLVEGYYGGGKTHFLHAVRELAWTYGFAVALVELSPTECPFDNALRVYQSVARRLSLAPSHPLEAAVPGWPSVIEQLLEQRVNQEVAALAEQGVLDAFAEARRTVRLWLQTTVGRASCESPSHRAAVVAHGIAFLEDNPRRLAATGAWLYGEDVPASELRDVGVFERLGASNGFLMLRAMVQMLAALGAGGTALLFDEADRNLSVSARKAQIIGDNLRQIIDLCGKQQLPRTLFLYAVPPEFMRTVVPDYPALAMRLRSPVALSVQSPQAVLIDLERVDLPPLALLQALGRKLVDVFVCAHDNSINPSIQQQNAETLAHACIQTQLELGHRRLFARTFVDILFQQHAQGPRVLSVDEARAMVLAARSASDEPTANAPAAITFEDY